MRIDRGTASTHHALIRPALSALAACVVASSSPLPLLAAPAGPPTTTELSRLATGLARIDFLLENWDGLTTECNGVSAGGELENRQVARTQNQNTCTKTPLKVQQYIGAASTKDPLFKAEKLMIRAQPLVADEKQEAYTEAVDAFTAQQQMAATMAYTSSWSGIENPNGSEEQIEENLLEAKKEVVNTQRTLRRVIQLLDLMELPPDSS
jgi:hypothetical protein